MTEVQWSFACGDVLPGCASTFSAATQEEILTQVAAHAARDHGMTSIDDATVNSVKQAMRQAPGLR